jgi:hypothetical protein
VRRVDLSKPESIVVRKEDDLILLTNYCYLCSSLVPADVTTSLSELHLCKAIRRAL